MQDSPPVVALHEFSCIFLSVKHEIAADRLGPLPTKPLIGLVIQIGTPICVPAAIFPFSSMATGISEEPACRFSNLSIFPCTVVAI